MTKKLKEPESEVKFFDNEHTRLLSTPDGDKYLCRECTKRYSTEELGVPESSATIMMRMVPWPTGNEPCDMCGKARVK